MGYTRVEYFTKARNIRQLELPILIGENIGASLSAIYNATGKWILDYAITPDKVLRALDRI